MVTLLPSLPITSQKNFVALLLLGREEREREKRERERGEKEEREKKQEGREREREEKIIFPFLSLSLVKDPDQRPNYSQLQEMDFFVKYDSGHVSVDVSSWYQRIKESK